MQKKKVPRKILSFLLASAMIVGMVPLPGTTVSAENSNENNAENNTNIDLLTLDTELPVGYESAENPYGYDEGVAFPLSIGHEIISLTSCNITDDDGVFKTTTLNGSDIDNLKSYVKNPSKNGEDYSFSLPDNDAWNWIQAVAFDNNPESAKDDKVLFIGVNDEKDAYAWVMDCSNSKSISPKLKIGDMDWIGDDYNQFASTSLFDVAAGDFDNDGIDSLFIYAPLDLKKDSSSPGCVLYELSYNGSNLSIKNNCSHLLMDQYITDQTNKVYTDSKKEKDTCRDKLAVSMQVADFNGDNIDDFAVLSYSQNRDSKANTAYYSPQLKICYGSKDFSFNNVTPNYTFTAATNDENTLIFPVAASLAAGDYNNDGYDDLYVVGVKSTATKGNDISDIYVDGELWYLHRFIAEYDNNSSSVVMKDKLSKVIASNDWFASGFYDSNDKNEDYCYGKTMAVGVDISGQGGAEMLFIAGSLYDVTTENPTLKITGSYFDSSDSGATSGWNSNKITNTFMQSVIVGNFDNNSAGREQVVFTIGLKSSGEDDYYYKSGFLCGSKFNDTQYTDDSVNYGPAINYYCTDLDDTDYILSDNGDDMDEGLNCLLIAVDYDNDIVEAKYLGVNFVYSDPVVNAVLQAAPYFGDITNCGTNSTAYTITTSYSSSSTKSNGGAISLGPNVRVEAGLFSVNGGAGAKGSFTKSFAKSEDKVYSQSFEATSEDLVIVKRIPLLIYRFDIKSKDDKTDQYVWSEKTLMEYISPQAPCYSQLSIDDYNSFANSYNEILEAAKKDNIIDSYTPLQNINPAENWMDGNEGNPYAYNQDGWLKYKDSLSAKAISTSSMDLGKSGGKATVSLSDGTSETKGTTWTAGAYVDFSLSIGPKRAGAGFDLSGDYDHCQVNETTTGNSTTSSFSVAGLDASSLLASGIPQDSFDCYTFKWTCGMWERDLGNRDEDGNMVKTPFLGYALTNISSPPMPVTDLKVTEQSTTDANTPKITLSWTKPDSPKGWPSIDHYKLYQVITEDDGSILYCPLGESEISNNATSISIDKTVDENLLEYDTEYTYVIRSAHTFTNNTTSGETASGETASGETASGETTTDETSKGTTAYSAYSNTVTVKTTHPSHTVAFDYDSKAVTVNAVKQGGITVNNGDQVIEGSILKITGKAQEGYTLVNLIITNATTKETTTVEPAEDGTITCYRRVKDDITFTFKTKKIITEANVSYTAKVYDKTDTEIEIGSVSAKISDQTLDSTGAAVSEPVTFTATAADTYVLTGWAVTVDGKPYYYATNNKTEFTLGLVGEEISVTAMFDKTQNIRKTITVEQPKEGGTIALYNADGIELVQLVPDDFGKCTVAYDSKITVVAVPATGYVIDSWSGAAVGQTEDRFTLNVIDDITIGIKYRAPIKYKLTYTTEDAHMNLVSTEPEITSGSTVAANTQVTLHAKAADGYRIEKWTITQGSESKEYILDDACYLSDSKEITMTANTTVEVSFTEIEEHTVTLKQTGKGTVSMIHGTKALNSGDKVHYMSNIALFAKPDDGWKLSNLTDWKATENGFFIKYIKGINEAQNINVVFEEIPADDNEDPDKDDSNKDDSNKDDSNKDDSGNTDNNPTQPDDENKPSSDGNNNNNSSDSESNNNQNNNNQNNNSNNSTSDKNNSGSDQKKPSNTSNTDSKATAKTGDTFSFLPVIGLFAAAVIICILLKKKKK